MRIPVIRRIEVPQFLLIFVIVLVGLAACSGQGASPGEAAEVMPVLTTEPQTTNPPAPSPTSTLIPTKTPIPTPTPIQLPPGEYIFYEDEYGVPSGLYAFSITNQKITQVMKGYPLFVSSSGKFIYSILGSNRIQVFSLETGEKSKIGKIPKDCRDQPPISMSLDPAWAVGACGHYEIWLFSLQEDQEIQQFIPLNDVEVWDLRWAPNGETIAYWGKNLEVFGATWKDGLYFLTLDCEIDYSTCDSTQIGPFLAKNSNRGYSMAWSSDSRYLAINLDPDDKTIYIFDTATNGVVHETIIPRGRIYDFFWSPDGQQLAVSTKEGIYLIPSMGGDQYDFELIIESLYTDVRGWITLEDGIGD